MSQPTDLEINCAVRRVLVRHWINLGRVSLRTINGVTTVWGALERLPNAGAELTGAGVRELLLETRRLRGIRRVHANFTNWEESEGGWQPTAANGDSLQTTCAASAPVHQ